MSLKSSVLHYSWSIALRTVLGFALLTGLIAGATVVAAPPTPQAPSASPAPQAGLAALADISQVCPHINVDMRYATPDNFAGKAFYTSPRALLIRPAAEALARVQADLESQGFGLRVWDAYRPRHVQWELWKICSDTRFVADPRRGSRHNRGASVDVTLLDRNGEPVEMPTVFDDFSERAGAFYREAPLAARRHRQILQRAMTRQGFRILESEWWHFDYETWRQYPIMDVAVTEP
jgi:D-alanyl-D-alanine dipeptidase